MDVDKYIEDILIEYNKTEFRIDELYKNYLELDFKILTNLGNKKNTYKSIQGSYDFLYKFFIPAKICRLIGVDLNIIKDKYNIKTLMEIKNYDKNFWNVGILFPGIYKLYKIKT